mmetsp:Transcript_33037/g.77255  ORF Transcript_33037/g.77255 Transcript_33037/m.77255 type:complete len:319 (-) Transcript_33037:63-1019(-)
MGCAASTTASAPAQPGTAVVQIHASGGAEVPGARPVAIAQLQRAEGPAAQPSAPQQNGAPQAPPTTTSQGREGNSSGSGMRSDLHQLPVRKALVSLKKEECALERADDGWYLPLQFSALTSGEAVVHFLATEAASSSSKGQLPTLSSKEVARHKFSKGLQQTCKIKLRSACSVEDFRQSLAAFKEGALDKDESRRQIVVDLVSDSTDVEAVVSVRSELKISSESESMPAKVVQQWVRSGDVVVKLEALYGTLAKRSQGEADESGECVICLSKPREVAILHCRHVCLCRSCAMITSSTWTIACPVCRGHVAGMCCEKVS